MMDTPWVTHVELATHGDWTAVRRLEEEIERRMLMDEYIRALADSPNEALIHVYDSGEYIDLDGVWNMLRAEPEQRARAFLAATE